MFFIAISVRAFIFDADNRFASTTSLKIFSKSFGKCENNYLVNHLIWPLVPSFLQVPAKSCLNRNNLSSPTCGSRSCRKLAKREKDHICTCWQLWCGLCDVTNHMTTTSSASHAVVWRIERPKQRFLARPYLRHLQYGPYTISNSKNVQ